MVHDQQRCIKLDKNPGFSWAQYLNRFVCGAIRISLCAGLDIFPSELFPAKIHEHTHILQQSQKEPIFFVLTKCLPRCNARLKDLSHSCCQSRINTLRLKKKAACFNITSLVYTFKWLQLCQLNSVRIRSKALRSQKADDYFWINYVSMWSKDDSHEMRNSFQLSRICKWL